MNAEVTDHKASDRLVIAADDAEAELAYDREGERLYLLHTEVPEVFRWQGTGGRLVTAAIDLARRDGLVVVPWCPFAHRWLREHPDVADDVTIDWAELPPATPSGPSRGVRHPCFPTSPPAGSSPPCAWSPQCTAPRTRGRQPRFIASSRARQWEQTSVEQHPTIDDRIAPRGRCTNGPVFEAARVHG